LINPFELAEAGKPGAVTQQSLFESEAETMVGDVDPTEETLLGRAIDACYSLAGITADPATHDHPCRAARPSGRPGRDPRPAGCGSWGLCSGHTTLPTKPPVFEHAFAHQREHFVNTGRPQGLDLIPGQVKYGL
jgi:hypothetical protein